MEHLDEIFHLYAPATYVCDGTEDGVNTAQFGTTLYTFMLGNPKAGSKIIFVNGRFYTDDPEMIVDNVDTVVEQPVTNPTETQSISFDEKTFYGSLPDGDEDVEQISYVEGENGKIIAGYTKSGVWYEIPLISSQEIVASQNTLSLHSVNFIENGTTLEVY